MSDSWSKILERAIGNHAGFQRAYLDDPEHPLSYGTAAAAYKAAYRLRRQAERERPSEVYKIAARKLGESEWGIFVLHLYSRTLVKPTPEDFDEMDELGGPDSRSYAGEDGEGA